MVGMHWLISQQVYLKTKFISPLFHFLVKYKVQCPCLKPFLNQNIYCWELSKKFSARSEPGNTPAPQPTFPGWSKGKILQFPDFGPKNITISCRLIVGFWFLCHTSYFGDHREEHYKVNSERWDMGESNMVVENVVNDTCGTIIKMSADKED